MMPCIDEMVCLSERLKDTFEKLEWNQLLEPEFVYLKYALSVTPSFSSNLLTIFRCFLTSIVRDDAEDLIVF